MPEYPRSAVNKLFEQRHEWEKVAKIFGVTALSIMALGIIQRITMSVHNRALADNVARIASDAKALLLHTEIERDRDAIASLTSLISAQEAAIGEKMKTLQSLSDLRALRMLLKAQQALAEERKGKASTRESQWAALSPKSPDQKERKIENQAAYAEREAQEQRRADELRALIATVEAQIATVQTRSPSALK